MRARRLPFVLLAAGWLLPYGAGLCADSPILEVVRRLRSIPSSEEVEGGEISPTTADDVLLLKHLLRDRLVDVVTASDAVDAPVAALRARVVEMLRMQGVPVGSEPAASPFGAILAIEMERPEENADWLVAVVTVSVPCGSDSSLHLFDRKNGRWRHALTYAANRTTHLSDARDGLTYRASPRASGRNAFLIVSDTNAWCYSSWRRLRYSVLRPGADAMRPVVLTSGQTSVNFGFDDTYDFAVRSDGFDFIYRGSSKEEGVVTSMSSISCSAEQGGMSCAKPHELIPPLWIDAWLKKPLTDEAQRVWQERLRAAEMGCWNHEERLQRVSGEHGEELRCVVRCKDLPAPLPGSLSFTFAPAPDGFRLSAIGKEPSATTPGPWKQVFFGGGPGVVDPVVRPETVVRPSLPAEARAASINAKRVRLVIEVESDGTVEAASLVNAEDLDHGFGVAAIDAVKKWRFTPGTAGGQPVNVSIEVEVEFAQ